MPPVSKHQETKRPRFDPARPCRIDAAFEQRSHREGKRDRRADVTFASAQADASPTRDLVEADSCPDHLVAAATSARRDQRPSVQTTRSQSRLHPEYPARAHAARWKIATKPSYGSPTKRQDQAPKQNGALVVSPMFR